MAGRYFKCMEVRDTLTPRISGTLRDSAEAVDGTTRHGLFGALTHMALDRDEAGTFLVYSRHAHCPPGRC